MNAEHDPSEGKGKPAGTHKKRLGRGLQGLLRGSGGPPATAAADTQPTEVSLARELPIDLIDENPFQPRKDFDREKLEELSRSIAGEGILQPLIVTESIRKESDRYTLVAGQRRLKAAAMAGLRVVPCMIRAADERQLREWALVENIQRADLNPIERAEAYREYINRFDATQEEISARLGVARSSVANYLRLLELAEECRKLVAEGTLSFGHAKVLASLADPEQVDRQVALAKKAVVDDLSVRALEKLIAEGTEKEKGGLKKDGDGKKKKPPYVLDMENRLTELLGTRVSLRPGKKNNTGQIVIEYYSLDDFDRIAGALGLDPE